MERILAYGCIKKCHFCSRTDKTALLIFLATGKKYLASLHYTGVLFTPSSIRTPPARVSTGQSGSDPGTAGMLPAPTRHCSPCAQGTVLSLLPDSHPSFHPACGCTTGGQNMSSSPQANPAEMQTNTKVTLA